MMTEDQAKKRWCPETRAIHAADNGDPQLPQAAYNRVFMPTKPPQQNGLCIGSQCMMWRWSSAINFEGYCGKAGRP